MMAGRTIDPEQNWFFQQGLKDGLEGQLRIPPDEARNLLQRSDYYAGHWAGTQERAARQQAETEEASGAAWRTRQRRRAMWARLRLKIGKPKWR